MADTPPMEDASYASDEELDKVDKKRPREGTEAFIDQVLQEEIARKAKKGKGEGQGGGMKVKEGKTLQEIEQDEGSTVRESLVSMAQAKRAVNRKAADQSVAADDTEIPAEVDKFEEEAQVLEEEGVLFTGFNLTEEREAGHFDEEGNYVERKEEGGTARDAWMDADDTKVVSMEVRKKIEARQKAAAAEEARPAVPLTDRQIAALKSEVAEHMQAGETVAKALKRLGGGGQQRAMGKREKLKLQAAAAAAVAVPAAAVAVPGAGGASTGTAPTPATTSSTVVFERLAEVADLLLVEGEVDVYDTTREEFLRLAAMWAPKPSSIPSPPAAPPGTAPPPPPSSTPVQGPPTAPAGDGDDDDMFAEEGAAAGTSTAGGSTGTGGRGVSAAAVADSTVAGIIPGRTPGVVPGIPGASPGSGAAAGGVGPVSEYASWPVKELKRFLEERGESAAAFVEKDEMVKRVQELATAGPVMGEDKQAASHPVPFGYVYDPPTGYYKHAEDPRWFFDPASGCYANEGKWVTL